jgi:hypothetical protein
MASTTDDSQTRLSYPNVLIFNASRFPFNPSKVVYASPKPQSNGGYRISCSYRLKGKLADGTPVNANVPIVLQSPKCKTSFGVSSKEYDGKLKSNIDITFYEDCGKEAEDFKAVMELWDRMLLAKAKSMKSEWFTSDKITDDILDFLYHPMIKRNKTKDGGEYPPSFRAKVGRRGNTITSEAYNAKEEPISMDEITRESVVALYCKHTGIFFNNTMFVSSHECQQIQKHADGVLSGFAFVSSNVIADEDSQMAE